MSGKGRRTPVASAAKSAPPTPATPVVSGIDEMVDEILERTERLKNEIISYRAKQATHSMSAGEKAIRKAAEAANKAAKTAGKESDLGALIIAERANFEKMTESDKDKYIALHNPPKPKAAPRKGGKK